MSDLSSLRRMAEKRDPLSIPTWDEVLRLVLVAEAARDYLATTNTLAFRPTKGMETAAANAHRALTEALRDV